MCSDWFTGLLTFPVLAVAFKFKMPISAKLDWLLGNGARFIENLNRSLIYSKYGEPSDFWEFGESPLKVQMNQNFEFSFFLGQFVD